jgi:hypothetical protein
MSRRFDKIVLLEQIENKLPNTRHCQLAEITGVLKSETAARESVR